MTSIGLSLLAMRRWRRFEKQVVEATEPLPPPWAVSHGHSRSGMLLGLVQLFRQIYHPLDLGTYAALRRLFLDKMQVCATAGSPCRIFRTAIQKLDLNNRDCSMRVGGPDDAALMCTHAAESPAVHHMHICIYALV